MIRKKKTSCRLALVTAVGLCTGTAFGAGGESSGLPDEPTEYLGEGELPKRTAPLEIGDAFLGTGNLKPGFKIPGGAVWQPRFWIYGDYRSGLQTYKDRAGTKNSEWANRMDLFGNLQLTGSERAVIGISPLGRGGRGGFSGYVFEPDDLEDQWVDDFNYDLTALFFEGDLAELFPRWDYDDSSPNDIGFSIGRQGVIFQDGMTINDIVDLVGFTRNSFRATGTSWLTNLRASFVYGWDSINRGELDKARKADLFGIFTQFDTVPSTINLDLIYVDAEPEEGGNLGVAALDFVQRIGKLNSTFRVAASRADEEDNVRAADGEIFFAELSIIPPHTDDTAYLNGFIANDNYTMAARDPATVPGPLLRTGLLFTAPALGTYPPALNPQATDAWGASLGYQKYLPNRQQVIFEIGTRQGDELNDGSGLAARYQKALGRRIVLVADGYAVDDEALDDTRYGLRGELLVRF